jgi:hypothetical protein
MGADVALPLMNILLLLLIVILLCGGGYGLHADPGWSGYHTGGIGLLVLVLIIVLIFR